MFHGQNESQAPRAERAISGRGLFIYHTNLRKLLCVSLLERGLSGCTEGIHSYIPPEEKRPAQPRSMRVPVGEAASYLTVLHTRFTRLPSCQRAAVQKSFESKQFPDKKNMSHSSNAPRQ